MEYKSLIIGEETVKKYLTVDDIIKCIEDTWRWYGEGTAFIHKKC